MQRLLSILLILSIGINSLAQQPDKGIEKDSLGFSNKVLASPSDNLKYIPNYSPLSPNSAVIQKFGDYKVNLATGITDIHIPIYEVISGELKMPIVLRYHPSGFKVYDQASWVGYGWALDWGASLNRTVQGLPDEGAGGYLQQIITLTKNFCNNADDYFYGGQLAGGAIDGQPDIFSYQIPGKSGHFILGSVGESVFKIPEYPIQIDLNKTTNAITDFKLVDDNGIAYEFSGQEKQDVTISGKNKIYTGSWLLSEVKSPNTADAIHYTYQSGGHSQHYQPSWNTQFYTNANPTSFGKYTNTTVSIPQQSSMFSSNTHKIPHKITFPNGELEFILGALRADQPNANYLESINLYLLEDGGKKLKKKIKFSYSYFKYGGNDAKLKLNSLTFTDETESKSETYTFDYWTETIAWPNYPQTTNAIDFFGYYNGATTNTHLIPVSHHNTIPVVGSAANRETVTTYLKNAMLKKITFPTLSYTEFDYESNQYKWQGAAKPGGGLRVKSIKSVSGNNTVLKRYEYASTDGQDVGLLATNWNPNSPKIALIQNLDYTRSPFDSLSPPDSRAKLHTYTQDGTATSLYTMDAAVIYYTRVSEYFEESGASHKNGKNIYNFDFYQDNIISSVDYATRIVRPWRRGNLLSKATYDKNNILVSTDSIQYAEMAVHSRLAAAFVSQPWVFDGVTGTNHPCPTTFQSSKPAYEYMPVSYQTGILLPKSNRSLVYGVNQREDIFYTDSTGIVDRIETMGSKPNEKMIESYQYAFSPAYWSSSTGMRERNMLNQRLETHKTHRIGSTNTVFFKGKQTYQNFPGQNTRGFAGNLLPKEYSDSHDGSTWVSRVIFENYNTKGRPTSYYLADKQVPVTLLWGYNHALLMAEMNNISLSEATSALISVGLDWENINNYQLTASQKTQIRNLQGYFPNGHITWYAYKPGIGLSNKIYPNGLLESYEYDALHRLKAVKDHNGKLVDYYRYQYATTNP